MNVSLYEAAAALTASARWQDLIAQNLAASTIPGFKKQNLSYSAIASGIMPSPTTNVTGKPLAYSIPQTSVSTDYQQGSLKLTNVNTDIAIVGYEMANFK